MPINLPASPSPTIKEVMLPRMTADLVPVEQASQVLAAGVPALPAAALGRLPAAVGLDADPYWRLVAAFLVGYQGHSRSAYFSDLRAWHAWCTASSSGWNGYKLS